MAKLTWSQDQAQGGGGEMLSGRFRLPPASLPSSGAVSNTDRIIRDLAHT